MTAAGEYEPHDAAERGFALLDNRRVGWLQHMDVPRLDMGNAEDCILGQLPKINGEAEFYSNYSANVADLVPMLADEIAHGFCSPMPTEATAGALPCDRRVGYYRARYAELTRAWRRLLIAHQSEAVQCLLDGGWMLSRDFSELINPLCPQDKHPINLTAMYAEEN